MSLLFLTRSLTYGGSERQLVSLVCELRRAGHSVAVATFYGGGPLEAELAAADVSLHVLGKQSRWDLPSFLRCLVKLVRQTHPSVLHSYLATSNILAILMKGIVPRMKVVWGVRASNMELERYGWLDRVVYWVECRLSRFADLIIVNSHAGRAYAQTHGFPPAKMVVIPNGMDTARFHADVGWRRTVRKEWGIPEDEFVIGLVGRLDPMKGHETFLQAAARVNQSRPEVRFVCIGDGPEQYRAALKKVAGTLQLTNVLWLTARRDIESVYTALDILTLPSSYGEGFSNALGEAMACEVPCIATDVGDSAHIVGETGIIVPPRDADALAAAMLRMIDMAPHDRAGLGKAARKRVSQHFGIAQLIQETSNALQQLLNPA